MDPGTLEWVRAQRCSWRSPDEEGGRVLAVHLTALNRGTSRGTLHSPWARFPEHDCSPMKQPPLQNLGRKIYLIVMTSSPAICGVPTVRRWWRLVAQHGPSPFGRPDPGRWSHFAKASPSRGRCRCELRFLPLLVERGGHGPGPVSPIYPTQHPP